MKAIDGYHPIKPEDFAWRPSNMMGIANARMSGRCSFLYVVIAILLNATWAFGKDGAVPNSSSPNEKYCVILKGENPFFWDIKSRRQCGFILPKWQRGEVSNLAIVSSWSKSGNKVALLIYYGTKLSEILLFATDSNGNFKPLSFEPPNIENLFKDRFSKYRSRSGCDENALGAWKDDETIGLVVGMAKEITGGNKHFIATYDAKSEGKIGQIENVRKIGVLTDKESADFFEERGEQFR